MNLILGQGLLETGAMMRRPCVREDHGNDACDLRKYGAAGACGPLPC